MTCSALMTSPAIQAKEDRGDKMLRFRPEKPLSTVEAFPLKIKKKKFFWGTRLQNGQSVAY